MKLHSRQAYNRCALLLCTWILLAASSKIVANCSINITVYAIFFFDSYMTALIRVRLSFRNRNSGPLSRRNIVWGFPCWLFSKDHPTWTGCRLYTCIIIPPSCVSSAGGWSAIIIDDGDQETMRSSSSTELWTCLRYAPIGWTLDMHDDASRPLSECDDVIETPMAVWDTDIAETWAQIHLPDSLLSLAVYSSRVGWDSHFFVLVDHAGCHGAYKSLAMGR